MLLQKEKNYLLKLLKYSPYKRNMLYPKEFRKCDEVPEERGPPVASSLLPPCFVAQGSERFRKLHLTADRLW